MSAVQASDLGNVRRFVSWFGVVEFRPDWRMIWIGSTWAHQDYRTGRLSIFTRSVGRGPASATFSGGPVQIAKEGFKCFGRQNNGRLIARVEIGKFQADEHSAVVVHCIADLDRSRIDVDRSHRFAPSVGIVPASAAYDKAVAA